MKKYDEYKVTKHGEFFSGIDDGFPGLPICPECHAVDGIEIMTEPAQVTVKYGEFSNVVCYQRLCKCKTCKCQFEQRGGFKKERTPLQSKNYSETLGTAIGIVIIIVIFVALIFL